MKKLIAALVALVAIIAMAVPAYQQGQYYVWSDATVASNALHYINVDSGWLPYEAPNGYRMDKWADAVQYRVDGKAVIPRIPTKLLELYGITPEQQELFFTTFSPTVEMVGTNWWPEVSE